MNKGNELESQKDQPNNKLINEFSDIEQKVSLYTLENQIKKNETTENLPDRQLITLNIQDNSYELYYDQSMLAKDFIRINCIVWSSKKSDSTLFTTPLNFSLPKELFSTNPVNLNADFRLSRSLTKEESAVFDEMIIRLASFHKESFRSTSQETKTTQEPVVSPQAVSEEVFEEESIEETVAERAIWANEQATEHVYFGAQFNLPSKKFLTITDWITNDVDIHDVLVPWYKVILIKDVEGKTTKVWWNGKSYIALGGERKGLRPLIHNGDSFINISDTHEVVVHPTAPRDLSDKKTACFIFAGKWHTIDSLIAPNQGSIAVDYTNTSNPTGWVHQAKRDAKQWTYIDQYTNKKVVTYDGIQITLGSIVDLGSQIHLHEDQEDSSPVISPRDIIYVAPLPGSEIGNINMVAPTKDVGKEIGTITHPSQWPDYNITPEVTRNQFCEALHAIESNNEWGPFWYGALNEHTKALGRYQFVWSKHHKDIRKVTGINDRNEFVASPQAQEKYMNHRITTLKTNANRIRRNEKNAKKFTDEELLALCHFMWWGWAESYVKNGRMLKNQIAHNVSAEKYLQIFNNSLALQKSTTKTDDIATK